MAHAAASGCAGLPCHAGRWFAPGVVAAALPAGCTLGPDYKRREVAAPKTFQVEPKEAAETADTQWWQQFGDPVLDALIVEALAHNQNMQIAAANVEYAAALLTQTRSQLCTYSATPGARRAKARELCRTGNEGWFL